MSVLDIREKSHKITCIRVCDKNKDSWTVELLTPTKSGGMSKVCLEDSQESLRQHGLVVHSKEHAQNLIRGLEKAIELGWFDK